MKNSKKANAFILNMQIKESSVDKIEKKPNNKEKFSGREGLKHIGGYFEVETVERVALLRARLRIDNSELIKRAIDELFAREKAKRAFAD